MNKKVMTAPLAIIKVNGKPVGKMKTIRATETIRRGRVSGLGEMTPQELAALEWNGTLNCSFYSINLTETGIPSAQNRKTGDVQSWIDTVLLQESGVTIDIYKKVLDTVDATTGIATPKLELFATIVGCFIDRESFDVSEGQISGQDQDFTYIEPILFSV
jgi:hypothetical protein